MPSPHSTAPAIASGVIGAKTSSSDPAITPFIGYPRTLNGLADINDVAGG